MILKAGRTMVPFLVCKPKQTHVLNFMQKSNFNFWNKKKNMFTRKNNTFRSLRSKAKSRRSKNRTFSNHFTEIQLGGTAAARNPLKSTPKGLHRPPNSSPECLQSLPKCLPGHQKASPSTTTETNKSPKCSRTTAKVKIVLWPAIQADFWTPRDTQN